MAGNPIGGKELRHLGKLRNLRSLDLSDTHCFATGLGLHTPRGNLRSSPLFRSAVLPHTGLEHLLSLQKLETLYLPGTGVALEEVVLLRDLPKLEVLALSSGWTDAERKEIQKQLPTTTISYTGQFVGRARVLFGNRRWGRRNTHNVPTWDEVEMVRRIRLQ